MSWPFRRKPRLPVVGEFVLVHRDVLEVAREIADAGAIIAFDTQWNGRCRLVSAMRRALERPVPTGQRWITAEEVALRVASVCAYEFERPAPEAKP